MRAALKEAAKAEGKSEVPVGAVVVCDGRIIARAHNVRTTACDPTAHAEIVALRKAGRKLGHWNLEGCELYVTKEPCVMCAGAVVLSRIKRVRYGAYDRRFGCARHRHEPCEQLRFQPPRRNGGRADGMRVRQTAHRFFQGAPKEKDGKRNR